MLEYAVGVLWASAMALGVDAPGTCVPVLDMTVMVGGCPIDICSDTCGVLEPQPDGSFLFSGSIELDGMPTTSWNIRFDPDPFVIANLVVSNNSNGPAEFVTAVGLPVQFPEPPGAMTYGGSVVGLLTDGNGDGAWVAAPLDGPLYSARIDGVEAFTLLDSGSKTTAPPFGTAAIGPAAFGDPVPSTPGPVAGNTLAIELQFTLSPGDTVAISSIFVGDAVPAVEEVQR